MKKKVFKNIIIGSGPSAIGGLLSLTTKNNAVITGFEFNKKNKSFSKIHKKILYESNGKNNHISNIYSDEKRNLFSISNIGGFGNYWGQGCEYVPFNKINNKKIFVNNKIYLSFINKIYKFFYVKRKDDFKLKLSKLFFYPSPILENSPNFKKLKLKSFKNAFNYLSKKNSFRVFNNSVEKLDEENSLIKIKLNDKSYIYGEKVFLAANTLGNASILFNSDKNIKKMSFLDDCPNIFYTYSLNNKLNNYISDFYSIISANYKSNFISAISLKNVDLSFFTYFLFKIKISFLKNKNFKILNNFIFFQLWNKKTIHKGYLYRNKTFKHIRPQFNSINFEKLLKKNNILTLKNNRTNFGEGFHYHNLRIMYENKWYYLSDYIKKKFSRKVICIDSSVEKKISPGPFTITQMAIAFRKLSLFLKK